MEYVSNILGADFPDSEIWNVVTRDADLKLRKNLKNFVPANLECEDEHLEKAKTNTWKKQGRIRGHTESKKPPYTKIPPNYPRNRGGKNKTAPQMWDDCSGMPRNRICGPTEFRADITVRNAKISLKCGRKNNNFASRTWDERDGEDKGRIWVRGERQKSKNPRIYNP